MYINSLTPTTDEAFQSRIHIAIRYPELDFKARRSIFAMFLNKVAALPLNQEKVDIVIPVEEEERGKTPGKPTDKTNPTAWKKSTTVKVVKCVHPNFSSDDLDRLARAHLNGRQIKNLVRGAQALAVNEGAEIKISHILQVMEVAEAFANDMRGGSGAVEALNGYL